MTSIKRTLTILAGVFLLAASGVASAVPIGFSVHGIITDADAGNAFGLDIGDFITAKGVFESTQLDTTNLSSAFVGFGSGTGNMLDVILGAIALNETDDIDYAGGFFPVLVVDLSSNELVGLDFITRIFAGATADFTSFSSFDGADVNGLIIEGDWLERSIKLRVLPEPASLSIFGFGLILLGVVRRRRISRIS